MNIPNEEQNEFLRSRYLKIVEELLKPPTPSEEKFAAEISKLPQLQVPIIERELLARWDMKPSKCHENCHSYVRKRPPHKSQVVVGWILDAGIYNLHSVVEQGGSLFCLTPTDLFDAKIPFILDRDISYQYIPGKVLSHTRNGELIEGDVRKDPQHMIAQAKIMKQQLESGMDPILAMNVK